MKREELLKLSLTEDKNVSTIVSNTVKKDTKMITKAKRDLDDQIEELEEELETRLSSSTPLDNAVVVVTFAKLKALKVQSKLYTEFEETYLK